MARSILALAAACFALPTACAAGDYMTYEGRGYGGPLGVGPNFHSSEPSKPKRYRKPRYKPSHKPSKNVKKRPAKETETAKSAPEKAAPATKDAVSQNSSISTGATTAAGSTQASAQETATKPSSDTETSSVGCKRFIPSIGETVTVPCD